MSSRWEERADSLGTVPPIKRPVGSWRREATVLRVSRHIAVALLVVIGALSALEATPSPAGATNPPAVHDVVDYAGGVTGTGPWARVNASVLPVTTQLLRSQVSLTVAGIQHIIGLNSAGHVIDLSADGPDGTWQSTDVTKLSNGPAISSNISAIATFGSAINIFGIGSGIGIGHLFEYTAGLNGQLWSYTDLTAQLHTPNLVTSPTMTFDAKSSLRVFSTDSSGELIQLLANSTGWSMQNITTSFGVPAFSSAVTTTESAGTPSVTCVFGLNASHHLIEAASGGPPSQRWRVTDLTTTLNAGTMAVRPTASLVDGRTVVADVQDTGAAVLATSNSYDFTSLTTAKALNISALSGGVLMAAVAPAISPTSTGILVAVSSQSGDLMTIQAPSNTSVRGFGTFTATDLNVGHALDFLVTGAPSITTSFGTIHIDVGTNNPGTRSDELRSGQSLPVDILLTSSNGVFHAGLSELGATVVTQGSAPIFTSNTSSHSPSMLQMGTDGDLRALATDGSVIWQVGSQTGPSTRAVLLPTGALELAKGGTIVWTSSSGVTDRILALETSQLGTGETPPGSNCNIYTAAFGRGYPCSANRAEEWCSDFANFAWQWAGANVTGISAWSFNFVIYGENHGTFFAGATNDPQPGDAVVWGDMGSSYGQHVGTVAAVYLGYIRVISGNDGNDSVGESDFFNPATSTISGYPIVGYIAPVAGATGAALRTASPLAATQRAYATPTQKQINSQDGGH